MAVRIEYILVFVIALLLLSILGINPSSQEAKSSKGEKEVLFQNFSILNIKTDDATQKMSASNAIKYKNYLEAKDVNISDENGYTLTSKRAIYDNDLIFLQDNVKVLREDGITFFTESLNYDVRVKEIATPRDFTLEFNRSRIKGENLKIYVDSKKILADNIVASIWFVSPNDKNTTQGLY